MGNLATEENAGYLAAGYAITYGGAFILTFYPAFVLGVQVSCICIDFLGYDEGTGYLWGIGLFFIGWFAIVCLSIFEKYKWLIFIYLITLTPFINFCRWVWYTDEYGNYSSIPFPGLEWIPFF